MDTIHKIISWMTSPLGVFFLGFAVGVLLRARGTRSPAGRRIGTFVMTLVAVLLWVFSCDVTTRVVGVPLEGDEIGVENEVEKVGGGGGGGVGVGVGGGGGGGKADAIVLLGGGMGVHRDCGRAEISAGADRVWMAARLWKAGRAPLLTVSGMGAPAELAFLADAGVNTNGVLNLLTAKNTEDEARLIREALDAHGTRHQTPGTKHRILLVTSAWHMPRAKMLFERAGFEVTPAPTDYEMHYAAEEPLSVRSFFPNCDALQRNSAAFKEWVARACYAIKR